MNKDQDIVEVKVNSGLLCREVLALKSLVPPTPVLPILSNFLFEITADTLTISASDLYTSVVKTIPVRASGQRELAVPASIFVDTLRNLPEQEITMQLDSKGYMLVLLTANGRYQILCENHTDFPPVPKAAKTSVVLDAKTLKVFKKALKKTLFAACKDEMKPNMCGVHLSIYPTEMIFASTNGYRLVRYAVEGNFGLQVAGITLPSRSVQLLAQLLPEQENKLTISIDSKHIYFSVENLAIVVSIIAEPFPPYEDAIPRNIPYQLTVATRTLQQTIRLMGCYADGTTHEVGLALSKDRMEVHAEDLKLSNKGESVIACNYDGQAMKIGLDAKLLLEMLNHMESEKVIFHLSQPQKAIILTPSPSDVGEDVRMLLMPILLRSTM